MDKANVAEWLLRRVVDPVRAAELIGDQLEAHPTAGRLRFWISIAQILLTFSWRTIVGLAASPVAGLVLGWAFFCFAISSTGGTFGLSEKTVADIKIDLLGVSILLWAATMFSVVRLGWRNALTGVGLIASVLWSTSYSFFSQRTPAIVFSILWAGFVLFCMGSAKRRRALGILFGAVVAAWLTAFAISKCPPHDPYSIFGLWQGLTAFFLVPVVESGTTMFLHRKLLASRDTGQ